MIRIIAVLCSLAHPSDCHEQIVASSISADLSVTGCEVGMPQLAQFMSLYPQYRLAGWRCEYGDKAKGQGI